MEAENAQYGNILQSDIADGYRDLPDKVLSGFQWVFYHFKLKSDYYATTDDDCVINLPLLVDYFSTNQKQFKAEPAAVHCAFRYNQFELPVR